MSQTFGWTPKQIREEMEDYDRVRYLKFLEGVGLANKEEENKK